MSTIKTCPNCGTEQPPDAPAGVCPKCLLKAGLNDPRSSAAPVDAPTIPPTEHGGDSSKSALRIGDKIKYFGDYELLDEIARGGMGVVFKARQVRLNRTVAIKMILFGQFAGGADVQRFQTEAEAAAQLDHPGIVPIFEVGEHEGHHYFSMGLVEGDSLAARISDGPLPPKEAAELVGRIAEAIQYAHDKGVIHRDLKPANILIDKDGQPRITDFGLAKRIKSDSNLTGTGQILGTPSYMPPEQASGRIDDVKQSADVYSLGAILYATLTGRPPFQADNPLDTLRHVLESEPIAPRQLNPSVPLDLETVCLKCLEKDGRRRYESAQELADELQRFLEGRPITARPISRPARAWRWCRRRPVVASLIGTLSVLLLVVAIVSPIIATHQASLRKTAEELAEQKGTLLDQKSELANRLGKALAKEQVASEDANYAYQMMLVQQIYGVKKNLARDVLNSLRPTSGQRDRRGFEWYYWQQAVEVGKPSTVTLRGPEGGARRLAFSPDGKLLATFGKARVRLWKVDEPDAFEELPVLTSDLGSVVFMPDGKSLIVATSDGLVREWNVGEQKFGSEMRHPGNLMCVAVSPDGSLLATAGAGGGDTGGTSSQVILWNSADGTIRRRLQGHPDFINSVDFSADGSSLVSGDDSGFVHIWSVATGERLPLQMRHHGQVEWVRFSPNSEAHLAFVLGRWGGPCISAWNLKTNDEAFTFSFGTKSAFAVSPDGKTVAVADGHSVVLYSASNGMRVTSLPTGAASVAFSPTGTMLAAGGDDGTIRIWRGPQEDKSLDH